MAHLLLLINQFEEPSTTVGLEQLDSATQLEMSQY